MLKRLAAAYLFLIFCASSASAQIAFDSSSSGETTNGTSVSYTHTVAGTSTLLVVGVHVGSASDLLNTPTYNGVALALIDKILISGADRWVYMYALENAPQGSHTLSVTATSAVNMAMVSASYTGTQGLPVDNSTKQWTVVGESPTSATTTLTPTTANTWTILVGAATYAPIGAGSGSTLRAKSGQFSSGPPFDRLAIVDSNAPINPAVATSMTVTGGGPYGEFGTVMASFAAAGTTNDPLPRLSNSSVQYVGGFRVPFSCGSDTLASGGTAIAFRPPSGSGSGTLYVLSRAGNVAEISIPTAVNSANLGSLPTADCVHPFVEPTEGVKSQGNIGGFDGHAEPTGMAVVDGKLWINNGIYYDPDGLQTLYTLARPLDLSVTGQVAGLFGLKSLKTGFKPSMASTSIAEISSDWTAAMGGNLFLSKFTRPTILSESYGPDAIVTSTSTLLSGGAGQHWAAATPLFYPGAHSPTGDNGDVTGNVYDFFSQAHNSGSVVQPKGTSSLLAFQVAGATRGNPDGYGFGYGCGCGSPAVNPGDLTCPTGSSCVNEPHYYDPERSDKGSHGYPYVYQVVEFDMNDLAAVVAGTKEPWDIDPGSIWEITFPISPAVAAQTSPTGNAQTLLSNATYDASTNRIYIAQVNCCDWHDLDPKPLIHVFQVNP